MSMPSSPPEPIYFAGICDSCHETWQDYSPAGRDQGCHTGKCSKCRNGVCADCEDFCELCNKTLCKAHQTKCRGCGGITCADCLNGGACAYCRDDEAARLAAITASVNTDYATMQRGVWFCYGCAIAGLIVAAFLYFGGLR